MTESIRYECANYTAHAPHMTKHNVYREGRVHSEWARCAGRIDRLSDDSLTADVESGLPYGFYTHPRQAAVLLEAPYEVRAALQDEAHTMANYQGGNPSGCLASALAEWKRSGTFPNRERAARHREAERAARAATGQFVVLPMEAVR